MNSSTWWLERTVPYELPPVKLFGRKRDHLSGAGWGRWDGGKFKALPIPNFQDGNPTKKLTEKLNLSGYDARRLRVFRDQQAGRVPTKTLRNVTSPSSKIDEQSSLSDHVTV